MDKFSQDSGNRSMAAFFFMFGFIVGIVAAWCIEHISLVVKP